MEKQIADALNAQRRSNSSARRADALEKLRAAWSVSDEFKPGVGLQRWASALTGFRVAATSWSPARACKKPAIDSLGLRQIDALIRKINLQARLVAELSYGTRTVKVLPGRARFAGHLAAKELASSLTIDSPSRFPLLSRQGIPLAGIFRTPAPGLRRDADPVSVTVRTTYGVAASALSNTRPPPA